MAKHRRTFAAAVCAFACVSTTLHAQHKPATTQAAADKGTLVIIGGGMTAAMAPQVYGLFADLLPARGFVGYLPTAGERNVKDGDATDGRLSSNLKGRTLKMIGQRAVGHHADAGDDRACGEAIISPSRSRFDLSPSHLRHITASEESDLIQIASAVDDPKHRQPGFR